MAGKRSDRASKMWDSNEVMIFCDLCLKEIEINNRRNPQFIKDGWKNVIVKFQECTGKLCNRAQMKSKWDELRKDWKLRLEIKYHAVWKLYSKWYFEKSKVLPGAVKFPDSISPELQDKLCMMFGYAVATGYYAWSTDTENLPPKAVNPCTGFIVTSTDVIEDLSTSSVGMSNNIRCNIPANQKKGNKRMKMSNKKVAECGQAVMSNLNELEESNRFSNRFLVKSSNTSRLFTISEAIKELGRHPEIRDNYQLFDFGTMFLMEEAHRETFLCLPDSIKVRWLKTRHTSAFK